MEKIIASLVNHSLLEFIVLFINSLRCIFNLRVIICVIIGVKKLKYLS